MRSSMLLGSRWLVVGVLALLCSSASAGDAAPAPTEPSFLVGSNRGLERWTTAGARQLVSRGPARHPRQAGRDAVIVINGRSLIGGRARIERVELATGARQPLATLPPFSCGQAADNPDAFELDLAMQSEDDFRVDREGGKACLTLLDRNINMASVILETEVDLSSGRSTRRLTMGSDQCKPPKDVIIDEDADSGCVRAHGSGPRAPAAEYPYSFTGSSRIVDQRTKTAAPAPRLRGYAPGAVSPSGRWMLLERLAGEGDYVYRVILLFDRETGAVHAIPRSAKEGWPPPSEVAGKRTIPALRVVGEDDVRWLDLSPASDVLVVGDLVVVPGARAFRVRGEIAR